MNTQQLLYLGEKYINNFIGVFPLNELPPILKAPCNFIVNTDTGNLPGTHWIAVRCKKYGISYVFDPLGFNYPSLLCYYISRRSLRVHYNRKSFQNPLNTTCGQHCILWLLSNQAHLEGIYSDK